MSRKPVEGGHNECDVFPFSDYLLKAEQLSFGLTVTVQGKPG